MHPNYADVIAQLHHKTRLWNLKLREQATLTSNLAMDQALFKAIQILIK